VSIPFTTSFIRIESLSRRTSSHVSAGSLTPTPVMSIPSNIGRRL
jgi:hypothetical protein